MTASDPLNLWILQTGKCHICKKADASISFCSLCGHWWCDGCNGRLLNRTGEAIKHMLGLIRPGCCGPAGVKMVWQDTYLNLRHTAIEGAHSDKYSKLIPGVWVASASNLDHNTLFSMWGIRFGGRLEVVVTRVWRRVVADA